MLGRTAMTLVLLGSNLLAGCTAHQGRTAGVGIGALGGATAIVGIGMATGCEPFPNDEDATCQTDEWEPDPVNGLRVAGVGLFLLGLGAMIFAAATEDQKTQVARSTDPSSDAAMEVEAEAETESASEREGELVNPDPALNWE